MEMAETPNNKLNMQMPISISPKWVGYPNKKTQNAAGIIESPLAPKIGKNHGTTKSVSEIQNHHLPSVLNRITVMA